MSHNRVNFPIQAGFIGPLATGFHFYKYTDPPPYGGFDNGLFGSSVSRNLLLQLDRINSVSYEIQAEPEIIKHFGKKSSLARPLIKPPTVKLDFSYYVNGIKNEARLGFDVNYAQFQSGHLGDSYYASKVCPISGFNSRELLRITGSPFRTYTCTDFRNLFFVTGPEGYDIRENKTDSLAHQLNWEWRFSDDKVANYHIASFGNCYIDNYSLRASVGAIPEASVSYTCENVKYMNTIDVEGNSVVPVIPGLDKQTFSPITNKYFQIPRTVDEGFPSAILPGDITLSISGLGKIYDIGIDFNDAKLQSFTLDIPMNRETLPALGWKLPLDRQITFPVLSTISTDLIVGDGVSGSLWHLFSGGHEYNFTLQMKSTSGCDFPKVVAYQIDAYNAILRSANFNTTLTENKTAKLVWDTEISTENLGTGIFISGRVNIADMNSLPTF